MADDRYIDALSGTPLPLRDGHLYIQWVYSPDGNGGNFTFEEVSAWLSVMNIWSSVADIRWEPSASDPVLDTDPRLRSIKETLATVQQFAESTDPNIVAASDSPFDTTGVLTAHYNVEHPAWTPGGLQPGGFMFLSMLHETGHLLGLEHPHDMLGGTGLFPGVDGKDENGNDIGFTADKGDFNLNTIVNTIMSYNDNTEFGMDRKVSWEVGFASTPMAFDIAAAQLMYGAVAHNTGDNIYYLRGDGGPGSSFRTIWDTGGIDTIQYDGFDPAYDSTSLTYIDLRAATLQHGEGGGGYVSRVDGGPAGSNGGFTIAADVTDFDHDGIFQVVIENAVGGPGRDQITGNEFANDLNGRAGTDSLRGMGGADRLTGGADKDTFLFDPNWGEDTITDFFVGGDFTGESLVFFEGSGIKSAGQFVKTLTTDGLKLTSGANSIVLNGLTSLDALKDWNWDFDRKLEDGHISGATVFADTNTNGVLDGGEVSTTTDANGTFVLTGGSGPLVAFGGTDISSGLPFAGKLKAPDGSIVITPLTTLLVGGVSESDILAAFNLPAGFDLRLGDPIAGMLAGHAGSAGVFVAGAKVIDTAIAIGTAVAGLGGDEADAIDDAFAAIVAAINALGAGKTLDLSDPATIASLLNTVAQDQDVDARALANAIASAIAQSNAAIDKHLATDGASQALLDNVSVTQAELQSNETPDAVNDSVAVHKGDKLIGNVLTNDSDPDGDVLQLVSIEGGTVGTTFAGKFGTLTVEADGDFTYVANRGNLPAKSVAQDSFEYAITDGSTGAASATLTVLILNDGQRYQAGANSTLTGGDGKDVLDGSAGGVTALGGNGADVLIGGAGDILTGGYGPDIFVFRPDFGANTITDFERKIDKIQFDESVFESVTDLFAHASDTDAGVLIDDGTGNHILIADVKLFQLQVSDFIVI